MTEKAQASELSGFEPVIKGFQAAGGALRGKAQTMVEPTGLSGTNTAGLEMAKELLHQSNIPPEKALLAFQVNKAKRIVAMMVGTSDTPGAVNYREYPNSMTFHLGGVFEQFPTLRPQGKRECRMYWSQDGSMIMIALGAGQAKRTGKRKSSGESADGGNGKTAKAARSAKTAKATRPAEAVAAKPEDAEPDGEKA